MGYSNKSILIRSIPKGRSLILLGGCNMPSHVLLHFLCEEHVVGGSTKLPDGKIERGKSFGE